MIVRLTLVRGISIRIVRLVVGEVVRRVGIGCGLLLSLDLGGGWMDFGGFCIAMFMSWLIIAKGTTMSK